MSSGVFCRETHYTYTPSDARAARALCFDDVRAERAPRVRGVKETPWGIPGMHVAHFRPMCLTAWNSLRHPTSPIMPRTGPTRFDVRSSRGGWPERTLGDHPHVLGPRVVRRKGASCPSCPRKVKIEKLRILPPISVVLYRDSPIENSSNLGQNSKKLNSC